MAASSHRAARAKRLPTWTVRAGSAGVTKDPVGGRFGLALRRFAWLVRAVWLPLVPPATVRRCQGGLGR
jgi:hypothetical protein